METLSSPIATSSALNESRLGASGSEITRRLLQALPPGRLFYSPRETEAILNISHATCYRLIAAKRLDARKLGAKTAITAESINALAASLPKIGEAA